MEASRFSFPTLMKSIKYELIVLQFSYQIDLNYNPDMWNLDQIHFSAFEIYTIFRHANLFSQYSVYWAQYFKCSDEII